MATTSTGAVTLNAGDRVQITITSAECAGIGDVLSVSGVLSGIVSSNACFGVGTSITLGPAPTSGTLSFTLTDARFGSGPFEVIGSYPTYQVFVEDGYGDGDFNDNILAVIVLPGCNPFKDPSKVDDPLLQDPYAQQVFDSLAQETGWDKPLHDQVERGGFFVVDKTHTLKFIPYEQFSGVPPGPCLSGPGPTQIKDLRAAGDSIIAQVHTHPKHSIHQMDPGNCWTLDSKGQLVHMPTDADGSLSLQNGPSTMDVARWKNSSTAPKYAGILVEPNRIYRWERDAAGKFRQKDYKTSKCLGGQR